MMPAPHFGSVPMLKLNPGLLALLSTLTIAGCRGDDPGTSDGSSSSGSTTAPVTTTDAPTTTDPTTTGVDGTTSGTTGTPTTGEPETTTTDNSGNFLTTNTDGGTTEGPGPAANGEACGSDDECISMNCVSLVGGMLTFCADCNEDADCVAPNTACSLSPATQSAMCTTGPEGSTCMSDDACMRGLQCEAVINVPIPGILPDTCGECADSGDCDMGTLCSPVFDLMMFSGQKECVEPGSVQNDQLCPEGPDGDMVCMSGHCTDAQIMGIITVFVCGECASDNDCGMGETCTPAEASMNGFSGSICG